MLSWYRKISDANKILLFMAVGIGIGLIFGQKATILRPLGDLFIRLLLMAAIPLVFCNLLAAFGSLTDSRIVGRVGLKCLFWYVTSAAFAVALGVWVMKIIHPGAGLKLSGTAASNVGAVPHVTDILLDLVPNNVFQAFALGNVAQIVIFAVFLGLVTLMLPEEKKQPLQRAYALVADLLRKLVVFVLRYAPIGIGALAADTVGRYGGSILGPLARFIGAIWVAELLMVLVYLVLLILVSRMSPIYFLAKTAPMYVTAAATCSSLATLVVSLDVAEKLKLPKSIYSFTLPLGAQLNKDGTAIMLAGVLMLSAQAIGMEFGVAQTLQIILMGLILSEGSGGVPGGGLVVAMIFVKAFNLPLEVPAIVAGIYRLIDMAITSTNVMGDMVGTILVASTEKALAADSAQHAG
jgi:Na+/H+-dicarboxylate symporter